MLRAIIFDMDGVIVNSEVAWHGIEYERYRELIPGWTLANHGDLTGMSLMDSHRLLGEKYGLDITWDDYLSYYDEAAKEVYGKRCDLIPGCMELLGELGDRGIPMGLASSSSHNWIGMVFERFPLQDFFDCVVSSGDVDGKGKPAPDVYLETVRRMGRRQRGLRAGDCAAMEDSRNGLRAALDAGLYSIGFRNGNNDSADLSGAALTVRGFDGEGRKRVLELFGDPPG